MPESDLELLIRAAQEAGRIALSCFGSPQDICEKPGGAGPVTSADLAVDAALSEMLRDARPDFGWLSEESPDDEARLTQSRVFIIDPIDGTRAFIDGARDWSHSLAIAEDGVITAAVVFAPVREELFAATNSSGTTCNGQPVSASARRDLACASVLCAKSNMDACHWAGGGAPNFRRSMMSSLALRLAMAAQGSSDAMLTLRPCWEWDIAAGALFVEAAGGIARDRRGASLRFNTRGRMVDGVVAGGAIYPQLAAALANARAGTNPTRNT